MAFEDWFSGDYGSDYTPMEGNTTPDTPGYFDNAGGTFGDWSEGNYDYQYGNPYDYGADWMHNSDTNTGSNFYGSDPLFQGGQAQQPVYQQSTNPSLNWGGAGSAVQGFLKDLFNKGTTANTIGQGVAALASGYQNKQLSNNMQQAASKLDPWASQRGFYQQQAKQAITDPYSSPIVKAQIEQLQNAQNIKDAAAGRRSNQLTSSPALMAAMAQVAQNYQNQMAQQGGAGINPSAAATALSSAANADASGYISPIAQLFGYQTGGNTNQNTLAAALQQMATGKAT